MVVQDYVAEDPPKEVHLFLACSLYYMQMYEEAEKVRRGSEAVVGKGGGRQRRICEHRGSVRRRALLELGTRKEGRQDKSCVEMAVWAELAESNRWWPDKLTVGGGLCCWQEAHKGPECALKSRVLFHVAHKLNHESKLLMYHSKLSDTQEDQLSLAAIHFMRAHYQEVRRVRQTGPGREEEEDGGGSRRREGGGTSQEGMTTWPVGLNQQTS